MSATSLARRWGSGVRRGVSAFVCIAGAAAIVFGLLYLFSGDLHGDAVRHVLHGVRAGHHAGRAAACLAGGAACVIAGWLIRPPQRG